MGWKKPKRDQAGDRVKDKLGWGVLPRVPPVAGGSLVEIVGHHFCIAVAD